jgi:hypothetical protein
LKKEQNRLLILLRQRLNQNFLIILSWSDGNG